MIPSQIENGISVRVDKIFIQTKHIASKIARYINIIITHAIDCDKNTQGRTLSFIWRGGQIFQNFFPHLKPTPHEHAF